MTFNEVIKELQTLGTAQNRKIYKRHGAGDNLFGVSFANLEKLRKKIKVDNELAIKLWDSGNVDARYLATMIADPRSVKEELLDRWVRDLDHYALVDLFVRHLVCQTSLVLKKAETWMNSDAEWITRAGWLLLALLAMKDGNLPDSYFEKYLKKIEKDIHQSKNRVKDAMNSALISIGIRNSSLEKQALSAAKKIGKVEVDHGETGCKTPDAASYIAKVKARKKKK